jgi:hypothetical protein
LPSNWDKQFVTEILAQASQRIAHGGLAQVHALSGTADVAFLQQRVKSHQQIEIKLFEAQGLLLIFDFSMLPIH